MTFNPELIDFFKRHNLYDEEMFEYLKDHSIMIDYEDEDQRCFVGTCYVINKKNNKLAKISVIIPYIYDDITMLISIHELVHGITLYKQLNKKYEEDISAETLPLLYEKLYILEKNNEKLTNYSKYLDSKITEKDTKYQFGLSVREELLKTYDYDYQKTAKELKRITKRHQRKNK